MTRELLKEIHMGKVKFFKHIKKHFDVYKATLVVEGGRLKEDKQEVDIDTSGKLTSTDGRASVCQSVQPMQETKSVLNSL